MCRECLRVCFRSPFLLFIQVHLLAQATTTPLSVWSVRSGSGRNFGLPLVSVCQQLLLVVQQLLSRLRRILCVGSWSSLVTSSSYAWCVKLTLYDGVDRAALLAQTAVDALCHVDVVSCCPPAAVHTLLSLDCDGLRRADGFTELAGDATLLSCWVPSQSVLASEAGRNGAFLEGVEDGVSAALSGIVSLQN